MDQREKMVAGVRFWNRVAIAERRILRRWREEPEYGREHLGLRR